MKSSLLGPFFHIIFLIRIIFAQVKNNRDYANHLFEQWLKYYQKITRKVVDVKVTKNSLIQMDDNLQEQNGNVSNLIFELDKTSEESIKMQMQQNLKLVENLNTEQQQRKKIIHNRQPSSKN